MCSPDKHHVPSLILYHLTLPYRYPSITLTNLPSSQLREGFKPAGTGDSGIGSYGEKAIVVKGASKNCENSSNVKCFYCNKMSHKMAYCWKKKADVGSNSSAGRNVFTKHSTNERVTNHSLIAHAKCHLCDDDRNNSFEEVMPL